MAGPDETRRRALKGAWARMVERYPKELGQFPDEPWDKESLILNADAASAYRAIKAAQQPATPAAAPTAADVEYQPNYPGLSRLSTGPPAPAPPRAPLTPADVGPTRTFWDPEDWKRRARDVGGALGLGEAGRGVGPRARYGAAREAIKPGDPLWKKGLAGIGTFFKPELEAGEAFVEAARPLHGAALIAATALDRPLPGPLQLGGITTRGDLLPIPWDIAGHFANPEVAARHRIMGERGDADPISRLADAYNQAKEAGEVPWKQSLPLEMVVDPTQLFPVVGVGGTILKGTRAGIGAVRGARAGTAAALPRPAVVMRGQPWLKSPQRTNYWDFLPLASPLIPSRSS